MESLGDSWQVEQYGDTLLFTEFISSRSPYHSPVSMGFLKSNYDNKLRRYAKGKGDEVTLTWLHCKG